MALTGRPECAVCGGFIDLHDDWEGQICLTTAAEKIERLRNVLRHVLIDSQEINICKMVSEALEEETE